MQARPNCPALQGSETGSAMTQNQQGAGAAPGQSLAGPSSPLRARWPGRMKPDGWVGACPPALPNPPPPGTQPLRAVESSVPLRDVSGQSCGLRFLGGGTVASRMKQRGEATLEQPRGGAGGTSNPQSHWEGPHGTLMSLTSGPEEPATWSSYIYLILWLLASPAITSGPQ